MMPQRFYASLTGPLFGAYFPLPVELMTDAQQRVALSTSKLKHLWCAIYTKEETEDCIRRHGGFMLPDRYARQLDYDSYEVNKCQPK